MLKNVKPTVWGLAAIAASALVSVPAAQAAELWVPELPSIQVGLPAGALPPPGVYGQLDNYFAQFVDYSGHGNKLPDAAIDALVEIPTILWVPGITVLGANYAAAIAIPFVYDSYQALQHVTPGPGNLGLFNTALVPAILSWMLPQHFFVRASTVFFLNDATNTMADLVKGNLKNGGAPTGNGYSTFLPDIGISWLNNGWDLSADLRFSVPLGSTTAPGYNYRTGNIFLGDYTVEKTVGAWTLGFGASQITQIQKDTFNGNTVPASLYRNWSIGPVVGYQFKGGMEVTALWAHSVMTTGGVGGDAFDLRLTTAF